MCAGALITLSAKAGGTAVMKFTKMQGLGNDYIYINAFEERVEDPAALAKKISDRHFGIGADGVILVRPSERPECAAYMHYINSDGTLAQMCGNGVRCFAKFLVDRGYVQASDGSFIADTLAGPKPISFTVDEQDKMTQATVDMGHPILDPQEVPVNAQANATSPLGTPYAKDVAIESPWGPFSFTCVSMGNPHAITFIEDFDVLPDDLFTGAPKELATLDLEKIGAFYESNPIFPEKANIEFAHISEKGIEMRVYERGCGETLACGTGACATCVAAALTERAGRENDLILRGGVLHILWTEDDHVMMTGPATEAFEGTVSL